MNDHDYEHGDRVRDVRDGTTGTVHVFELDPSENADEVVTAEVRWDGLATADELDVARPHIEPVNPDRTTAREAVDLLRELVRLLPSYVAAVLDAKETPFRALDNHGGEPANVSALAARERERELGARVLAISARADELAEAQWSETLTQAADEQARRAAGTD